MPRNSSGTYTLPEAAFVPSTPISSAAVNSDFDDVADALTDSLSRSGDGGMTAALPLNIAGFFYQGDADTGMSRSDPNTQVITCGGVDVVKVTPTGASLLGAALIPMPVGAVMLWSLSAAPSGWLFPGTYLRATYPALWAAAQADIALGNTFYGVGDGATNFTIGTMDGYAPVGVDAGGTRLPGVANIGATTGNKEVTLAANQIPTITATNSGQAITVYPGSGNVGAPSPARNVPSIDSPISWTNAFGFASGANPGIFPTGGTSVRNNSEFSASNSISATYTNASQQPTAIVQPSRAFKFIVYAGD